ncbi:MAG: hypothetical protein FWD76_05655 [Firmicutes bacterium]|nr:hypothetical protein [Bacillota bacterium]
MGDEPKIVVECIHIVGVVSCVPSKLRTQIYRKSYVYAKLLIDMVQYLYHILYRGQGLQSRHQDRLCPSLACHLWSEILMGAFFPK